MSAACCPRRLALILALAGCVLELAWADPEPTEAAGGSAANLDVWPHPAPALPPDPALEQRVAALVARMSLEEKVGQIIQPEIKSITPAEVKEFHIGAVLSGGGTTPGNDRHAPVSAWVALADAYWHASMDTRDGGLAIPVLWGIDAVHGHNNLIGATLFPHNIGLGATRDPDLIRRIGAATAAEVRATGLDWTFAPTVAVATDTRWGRTFESYGEDPEQVRQYARALVTGIQGRAGTDQFLAGHRLLAGAKHFLGDGGTRDGLDRGDTLATEAELARVHAAGFLAAIEAGVQTVMASFNSWNGERLHGHRYLLSEVLKRRLGFDGFVVGDWNGHRLVPGCRVDSCPAALEAGLDMFMVPADWRALYHNTLAEARRGDLDIARLDDAVTRILRVKMRAGLFRAGPPSTRAGVGDAARIGAAEHRRLAREAVRKSLVLLKNDQGLLPLARAGNVLVAGAAAHDVARQSGGWTLTWQGTGTAAGDFPGATTIFEGIRAAVVAGGGRAVLSETGVWSEATFDGSRPDVAIVVFGEPPYAEWHGDLPSIEYQRGGKTDLALLRRLSEQGVPVVGVFVTGRPLWVNREINATDAFVVAWLPGSEGAGVADVLFRDADGGIAHDFVGRLPFSWPKAIHQRVLNDRQNVYDPQFAAGDGLGYHDDGRLPQLPENADYGGHPVDETWLLVARAVPPWKLQLDATVTAEPTDWRFEEDAWRLTWHGGRSARIRLTAPAPQDLSSYLNEHAALTLALRLDEAPTAPVSVAMQCGAGCSAELPVERLVARTSAGEWRRLAIDLACFREAGADLRRVTEGLVLATDGRLGLSLGDVRIVPGAARTADLRCQASGEGL